MDYWRWLSWAGVPDSRSRADRAQKDGSGEPCHTGDSHQQEYSDTISCPVTILFNENLLLFPIPKLIHIFVLDLGLSFKCTLSLGQLPDTNLYLIPGFHFYILSGKFSPFRRPFSITVSSTMSSCPSLSSCAERRCVSKVASARLGSDRNMLEHLGSHQDCHLRSSRGPHCCIHTHVQESPNQTGGREWAPHPSQDKKNTRVVWMCDLSADPS